MFKHIFGQALFQLIILCIFLFGGEYFLPEYSDSWDDDLKKKILTDKKFQARYQYWWQAKYNDDTLSKIVPGRALSYDGLTEEYKFMEREYAYPSRHFTYIFVVFVLMQLVNFVNARKLKDEFNIFNGISRNYLFPVIVFICLAFQIILTTFGGYAFHCYPNFGLDPRQWLICLGFALMSWIMSILL